MCHVNITRFARVMGVVVSLGGLELVRGRCDLDYCTSTSPKWCMLFDHPNNIY